MLSVTSLVLFALYVCVRTRACVCVHHMCCASLSPRDGGARVMASRGHTTPACRRDGGCARACVCARAHPPHVFCEPLPQGRGGGRGHGFTWSHLACRHWPRLHASILSFETLEFTPPNKKLIQWFSLPALESTYPKKISLSDFCFDIHPLRFLLFMVCSL